MLLEYRSLTVPGEGGFFTILLGHQSRHTFACTLALLIDACLVRTIGSFFPHVLFLVHVGEAVFEVLPRMWRCLPPPSAGLPILQLYFPRRQAFSPQLSLRARRATLQKGEFEPQPVG